MSSSHRARPHRDRPHWELPQLGRRGGGWVTAQVVLLAAIFLSALVRFSWPGEIEPFAYAVGGVLAAAGLGLLAVFADLKASREELWLEQTFTRYADGQHVSPPQARAEQRFTL